MGFTHAWFTPQDRPNQPCQTKGLQRELSFDIAMDTVKSKYTRDFFVLTTPKTKKE